MSPRNLVQQPLYLDPSDASTLDQLAAETSKQKQVLLREGVKDLFIKYRSQGFLKPTVDVTDLEGLRKAVAREIRAAASVDVDALVKSGALVPKRGGWYVVKDIEVLPKLSLLLDRTSQSNKRDGTSELRVHLTSIDKYKDLAAKLRPEF